MSQIAQFPIEILASVTVLLDGFSIARLYLSGDKALMVRLERGGVTRFDLVMAQKVNRKWPTLISQFQRLEYLRIVPRTVYHRIWFSGVDFRSLPPTIRHLELDFDNLESVLIGSPFVVQDLYPDPIWSPSSIPQLSEPPFPMSNHWPNLESLRIRRSKVEALSLVPLLPQSLLTLCLPQETITSDWVRQLPPNLTHLELPVAPTIEKSVTLPSTLTFLNLNGITDIKPDTLSRFPTSLLHVHLWTLFMDVDKLFFDWRPSCLVTLEIEGIYVPSYSESLIPATIRHLSVYSWSFLETLPLMLESLIIANASSITDEHVCKLPRTLTHCSINFAELSSDGFKDLPPFLRVLDHTAPLEAREAPYPFIPYLEELDGDMVDPLVLQNAQKLRILVVSSFSTDDMSPLQHLSSLRSVTVTSMGSKPDKSFFASLPASVTDLSIFGFSPSAAKLLPRGLKRLHILHEISLSDEVVRNLPPDLTELNVASDGESISNHGIVLLPRTLEHLCISASKVTDEAISRLPPHLVLCTLRNAKSLTNSCASLFPRRIVHLILINCPNVTHASLKHLPRTLENLSFVGGPHTQARFHHQDLPSHTVFSSGQ